MCGIVGLYLKDPSWQPALGRLIAGMVAEMNDRGPDSAGVAIYGNAAPRDAFKATLFHPAQDFDWPHFEAALQDAYGLGEPAMRHGSHRVVTVHTDHATLRGWLAHRYPGMRLMGFGKRVEIFKEMGLPVEVLRDFGIAGMSGSHALGHTRMATESAVTTEHSHPFSTGVDLCLVHNGSLSNHNRLRGYLARRGLDFTTDNDTEVAAAYFTYRMSEGDSLKEALEAGLKDIDGFYTFAVGTRDGFAILRDPIACKPAVMAETDDWVAMATEYRAIATLPNIESAIVWEPRPATVYAWQKQ